MSMFFTVTATGKVTLTAEQDGLPDGFDAETAARDELPTWTNIEVEDVEVIRASIEMEVSIRLPDIEVAAQDLDDFDAEQVLDEAISYHGPVTDAEFEIDDSPTAFGLVEEAIGRDNAIEAYAVLARAGYEIS